MTKKYHVTTHDLDLESPLVDKSVQVTYLDIDANEECPPSGLDEPLSMFSTKGTVVEDASGWLCVVGTILTSRDSKKKPLWRQLVRVPHSLIRSIEIIKEA